MDDETNVLNVQMQNTNKTTEPEPKQPEQTPKPPIEHIVLSGGAVWGFKAYGALREAAKIGIYDPKNIKTMFMSSVGCMCGILIAMGFEFDVIDTYLIKRPWQQVWGVSPASILNIYQTRGIYTSAFMTEYFRPFFAAKDWPIDFTMAQFYEATGIELHIYVVEMNAFVSVDISHKTHPDWSVVEAAYMSCSLPVLFAPIIKDGGCYVDGCFMVNYPLKQCISVVGEENKDRIFALLLTDKCLNGEKNTATSTFTSASASAESSMQNQCVTELSNFFDYAILLASRLMYSRMFISDTDTHVPNEIWVQVEPITLELLDKLLNSTEDRRRIVEEGAQCIKLREPRFPQYPLLLSFENKK